MMELFIVMTLSFMVGSLLSACVAFMLMLNKKFMKFYMKKLNGITNEVIKEMMPDVYEDEES